jgi:glycosyltransferase involved in cell wall biosynthesis
MRRRHRITFVTVVPSPYQRDLFGALAARDDLELIVLYMEAASPDSPWARTALRPFERVMPGFWVPYRDARFHVNWELPDMSESDFVVLSSYSSWTGQWLMRHRLRGRRWLYWGERLRQQAARWQDFIQQRLTAPLKQAYGLVGVGREAEADYARRFPGIQHFCIPYHCDLSQFSRASRSSGESTPFTFLFCGQMIRRKGVDLLLTAFGQLVASGRNVRLILVGREADLPIFLKPVSAAARARISYEGFKEPAQLPAYFSRSDAFVLPSRHDGWGVVINQALATGLPIITSDAVGAGLDLVENGVNGLRVAAGDAQALFRSMEGLVDAPDTARQWGEASRRKALELTPEAGAEKWVRVFDCIAE